jgi:hypothetical protein
MQANTNPRGRTIAAATDVNIFDSFGAPIQLIQNQGATDANVLFNGGVAFVVRASETIVFNIPLLGVINSDVALVALA